MVQDGAGPRPDLVTGTLVAVTLGGQRMSDGQGRSQTGPQGGAAGGCFEADFRSLAELLDLSGSDPDVAVGGLSRVLPASHQSRVEENKSSHHENAHGYPDSGSLLHPADNKILGLALRNEIESSEAKRRLDFRVDLNQWVGLATMVISSIGLLSAWNDPVFWQLFSLWLAIGAAGGVLGYLWQRPNVDQGRLILASALSFVPLSSAMVFLDGGLASSLWLLLLVGALSSAFAIHTMVYFAVSLSVLGMALSLWGPLLLTYGLRLEDGIQVSIRCATLLFVWMITHRIVRAQAQDASARLESERNERLVIEEAASLRERIGQQRKMEALGRLAGGVAHDFNNLLTIILSVGDGLKERHDELGVDMEEIQDLIDASEQAAGLTQQLLRFSRGGTLSNEPIDLSELVLDSTRMLVRILPAHIRISVKVNVDSPIVLADRNELKQVLMNLALNARDAIESEGDIRITISQLDLRGDLTSPVGGLAPGDYLQIAVQDNGTGMSEEVKSRAMEPFFTTKEDGRGTGIGLASAYTIAVKYGGTMVLESKEGKGTTVRFFIRRWLPGSASESSSPEDALPQHLLPRSHTLGSGVAAAMRGGIEDTVGSTTRVVFVDDEPGVRRVVSRLLTACGYQVITYDSPKAFLDSSGGPVRYDALVTDINMPGMSGIDLVRLLERTGRVRPTLFISGYFGDDLDLKGFARDCYGFLEKPLVRDSLDAALRDCIRRFQLSQPDGAPSTV